MPEPLVSEDSDLQRLLDTVHSQPGAEILYQDTVRRGGVLGFFAREVHRVAYRVAEPDASSAVTDPADAAPVADRPAPEPVATRLPALEELLASADAAELAGDAGQHQTAATAVGQPDGDEPPARAGRSQPGAHRPGAHRPGIHRLEAAQPGTGQPATGQPATGLPEAEQPEAGQPDFATLLRSLTAGDPVGVDASGPAARIPDPLGARPATDRSEQPAMIVPPRGAGEPKSNVTAFGKPDARARLEMLMQLRQVGVPVSVNPRADTHSLYEALENILEELPAPATPPRGAGQVLAVVGESGPALQAAHTCAAMLRLPRNSIGVAGLPEHTGAELDYPRISGRAEALRLRTELSQAELPSIVVVATDSVDSGSDDPWAAELLAALCPTAVWAVVDARWKTEDSRAELDRLDRVDALVVHSAQLSASPASVWDLDLPLGLLDGRAATTFAWTGLLFTLLRAGARHRASA